MKASKISLVLLFTVLGLSIMIGSAYAQAPDITIWQAKWFKGKAVNKGWNHVDGYPDEKKSYTTNSYLRFGDLDVVNSVLPMTVCIYDSTIADWILMPLNIAYAATDSLHFLGHIQEDIAGTVGTDTIGMTIRVVGSMRGGTLTSATFTTLGGYTKGNACQIDCAGFDLSEIGYRSLNVTGKLVDPLKVPDDLRAKFIH